jgi:hypothetical protein
MKARFAVVALVVASLSSCGDDERPVPEFKPGQMVRMKAFGNEGMVVDVWCNRVRHGGACNYSVRFDSLQITTNTRLLGRDGPISFAPVAIVRGIQQFELEAAE